MLQTTFLWYLVQIEHYQSLSVAAENLHVSQPALSSGIKKLEEQLGVPLLYRTNKGVTLTEEGLAITEQARKVFAMLDEIETMFQDIPKDNTQSLLDDVIIYANPAYIPFLMSELSKHYDNQKATHALQIFNISPDENIQEIVASSQSTVALIIVSDDYELADNISMSILSTSKSYIMCAKNFPYISPEQKSISFKEIVHVPLILSKESFAFQNILLDTIKHYGEPTVSMIAPNFSSINSAIKNGNVAGFTNKLFGANDADLRLIPIRNAPAFHLCLLYGKNTPPTTILQLAELLTPILT